MHLTTWYYKQNRAEGSLLCFQAVQKQKHGYREHIHQFFQEDLWRTGLLGESRALFVLRISPLEHWYSIFLKH